MNKQLFYVFDEHTDFVDECIKIGMKPVKGYPFVEVFDFEGILYKTLSVHECYSGWEITVMAWPRMNYQQLINTLQKSTVYDEIVGCLGILLKEYLQEFMQYLSQCPKTDQKTKKIKKMIAKELADRSAPVGTMLELLHLCR